jgi:predicted PurR-regulated permease PerM
MTSTRFFLDPRTARATWTILVIFGALGLVYTVRRLLLLAALSLFFAFLLFPAVRLVERWLGPRRLLAIVVVYLALLAALGGAGFAVGPRLSSEAQSLAQKLPEMTTRIHSGAVFGGLLQRHGWESREIRELERLVQTHMGEIIGYAQQATAALVTWLAGAWVVVLIPVFALFILKDVERLTSTAIWRLGHRGSRGMWWGMAEDLHLLLGQYVRALLLLSLATFAAWSAVFLTAGVPYALVLAGVGAALEFLPVIGPLTAGIVTIGVSLFAGYPHPWLLALFLLVWRVIQDYGISPLVMARGIEIHPALVLFGVIGGGEIAGVAGMFLSVPVIAAIRIVWRRLQSPDDVDTEARGLDSPLPERVAASPPGRADLGEVSH